MKALKIKRIPVADGWLVQLSGSVNELLDKNSLVGGLGGVVVFDFEGVTRITSFGVRAWIHAIRKLRAEYYCYVRCRPCIMSQFNMVAGFGGVGELVSFYTPYLCPSCGTKTESLVDLRTQYQVVVAAELPCVRCTCGTTAEFDDVPEQFLSYVASRPPPAVPPAAQRIVDARGSDGPARLKVQKEVAGVVTALWFVGPIDERIRLKRLLDGLEGLVLLEMSGVTTANAAGIERLVSAVRSAQTKGRYYARVRPAVVSLIDHDLQDAGGILVSLLLSAPCPFCEEELVAELDCAERPPEGGQLPAECLSCGKPSSVPVPPSIVGIVPRQPAPPPEINAYLEQRRILESVTTGRGLTRKYEEIKRIGSGGMAEVFLARQRGLGGFEKSVVLKRILPSLAENAEFVAMFLQEARIAARISHPNVVQIFDLGREGDHLFIAMEFVDGWDLRSVLRTLRRSDALMPVEVACRIIANVCAGLQAAHTTTDENGNCLHIVHRDVSPHNILISRDGTAKIADFGVAKAMVSRKMTPDTRPGVLKGKIPYMAPELIEGREHASGPFGDLFATGLVLFECLTGHHPYARGNDTETLYALLTREPPSARAERPDIPEALDLIVMRSLRREPSLRHPSASAMQMELEAVLMGLGHPMTSVQVAEWLDRYVAGCSPATIDADLTVTVDGDSSDQERSGLTSSAGSATSKGMPKSGGS